MKFYTLHVAVLLLFTELTWAGCPAKDFAGFLKKFEASGVIQERYTQFPLNYKYVDAASVDLDQHEIAAKSAQEVPYSRNFSGTLLPSLTMRKKANLSLKIEKKFTVIVAQPDTDAGLVFHFSKTPDCWILISIENQTL